MVDRGLVGRGEQRQGRQAGRAQGGQGSAYGAGGAPAGVEDKDVDGQGSVQDCQVGVEETFRLGPGVGVRADVEDVGLGSERSVRRSGRHDQDRTAGHAAYVSQAGRDPACVRLAARRPGRRGRHNP